MSWAALNYGFWEFWAPYDPGAGFYGSQKCIFDGLNKLIYVNPNDTDISIKEDVYSGWKEWASVGDNSKFLPAIRTTGGDPIAGTTSFTGDTYFLINGWRFLINHSLNIDGVIYSDDFPSPFVQVEGTQIVTNKVSALVQTVTTETIAGIEIPTVQDIRNEMDVNSVKLLQIKAILDSMPAPTSVEIRQEIDSNSTKLNQIKAKTDTITQPPTVGEIATSVWSEDVSGYTSGAGKVLADVPSKEEIAEQTWQTPLTITLNPGTFGHYIAKKVLTISKFIGLR